MRGRLLPARGGPGSPLSVQEVIKAAQAKAHRDASVQRLREAVSSLVKQAEGELGASLRSTLGSRHGPELAAQAAEEVSDTEIHHGTSPGAPGHLVPADKGLGTHWAPNEADRASIGLHEDQEKQAFVRQLLATGRRGAASLAARGGRAGRVGRFLQRDVRNPIQVARTGKSSASVGVRSPMAPSKTPPPIPADAAKGGPYRSPGKVAPPREKVVDMTRHAKAVGGPGFKPRGLTSTLAGPALAIGGLAGLYYGVPKAVNWATRAGASPMAYNFGHQQYMYGFSPEGQAQF